MWGAFLRCMRMLTTGVVMSIGAEQGGLPQASPGIGGGVGMPFAKSFGEVAAGAGIEAASSAGQRLMGDSAGKPVVEKSVGAAAIDPVAVQVKVAGGQVLNVQEAGKTAVSGKSLDEPTKVLTAGKGTTAEVPVKSSVEQVSAVDVKKAGDSLPVPAGQAEIAEDTAMMQETAKVGQTQVAAMPPVPPAAASTGAQGSSRVHDGERGGKVQVTAPAKKETKSKGNAAASEVHAKAVGVSTGVAGVQAPTVAPAVPLHGTAPVIVSMDQMNRTVEGDSSVVASASSGRTVVKVDGSGVKGRAQIEKGVARESRSVSSATSDEGIGRTQKSETGLAHTTPVANDVKGQAGSAVAVPVVHGAAGLTVQSVAGAAPTKTHMSGADSSVVRVQDDAGPVAMTVPDSEGHRTLTATPTTLEVGVANGTHGWLKVRAELTDGTVNASLSAASSAGQEMLHRELPSLTAYLQSERVGVSSVVLHASTAEPGTGQFAGGMEGDAGRGQMQQSGGQSGDSRQGTEMTAFSDRADETLSFDQMSGVDAAGWLAPAGGTARSGGWLNVRA